MVFFYVIHNCRFIPMIYKGWWGEGEN